MKFIALTSLCLNLHACWAFAPQAKTTSFGLVSTGKYVSDSQMYMNDEKVPFFASEAKGEEKSDAVEEESSETGDDLIMKEVKMSKMKTKSGLEYAPWLNIDAKEKEKLRQIAKEKEAIREKQKQKELSLSGNLYYDSQSQELGGAGLNSKIIDGEVELEWVTRRETNTAGYILKRRAAKTENFEVIADFKSWGPLASKGPEGGVYRFLDTTTTPGGYIYRVTEVDNNGVESDLSQCLVEIETEEEQRNAVIAAVGIVVVAIGAVVGGLVLDPYAG